MFLKGVCLVILWSLCAKLLVNLRGGKKRKKKERVKKGKTKESANRLFSQAGLFLIVGSTSQLLHVNKCTFMLTHHTDLKVHEPFRKESSEKHHKLIGSAHSYERLVYEC